MKGVGLSIDIQGLKEVMGELDAAGLKTADLMGEVITDLILETHSGAIESIQGGAKSGRIYTRRGITHQASGPGQAPATDTGRLASSIAMELPGGGNVIKGVVGTGVQYGKHLEFGTSRMAARPWLLPAFKRATAKVKSMLTARLKRGS